MNKENYVLTIDQIQKEISSFKKDSDKRKARAQLIAIACMIQGADHRNLTPLAEFAKVLSEAEQTCLRLWAEKYSPARKRKSKEQGFVYKFAVLKDGETEQVFDFDGMERENFLDMPVEKIILERIFGSSNYLGRIQKIVDEIDQAVKGEKQGLTIKEDEKNQVVNLRNILAGILKADLDAEVEEVTLGEQTKAAA